MLLELLFVENVIGSFSEVFCAESIFGGSLESS